MPLIWTQRRLDLFVSLGCLTSLAAVSFCFIFESMLCSAVSADTFLLVQSLSKSQAKKLNELHFLRCHMEEVNSFSAAHLRVLWTYLPCRIACRCSSLKLCIWKSQTYLDDRHTSRVAKVQTAGKLFNCGSLAIFISGHRLKLSDNGTFRRPRLPAMRMWNLNIHMVLTIAQCKKRHIFQRHCVTQMLEHILF